MKYFLGNIIDNHMAKKEVDIVKTLEVSTENINFDLFCMTETY